MDVIDEGTYLKTLACACSNRGTAVYLATGRQSRLHDVDGDFHRDGRDDDPQIICDVCGRVMPA